MAIKTAYLGLASAAAVGALAIAGLGFVLYADDSDAAAAPTAEKLVVAVEKKAADKPAPEAGEDIGKISDGPDTFVAPSNPVNVVVPNNGGGTPPPANNNTNHTEKPKHEDTKTEEHKPDVVVDPVHNPVKDGPDKVENTNQDNSGEAPTSTKPDVVTEHGTTNQDGHS